MIAVLVVANVKIEARRVFAALLSSAGLGGGA